jgi:hypothetical protein
MFQYPPEQNPQAVHLERATVEDIIKKIDRARVKMEQIKSGSTQPREKRKGLIYKATYGTCY